MLKPLDDWFLYQWHFTGPAGRTAEGSDMEEATGLVAILVCVLMMTAISRRIQGIIITLLNP